MSIVEFWGQMTANPLLFVAVVALGVFVMTLFNATVAETITKMVDLGGNPDDPDKAIVALSAALFAIVLWATLANTWANVSAR